MIPVKFSPHITKTSTCRQYRRRQYSNHHELASETIYSLYIHGFIAYTTRDCVLPSRRVANRLPTDEHRRYVNIFQKFPYCTIFFSVSYAFWAWWKIFGALPSDLAFITVSTSARTRYPILQMKRTILLGTHLHSSLSSCTTRFDTSHCTTQLAHLLLDLACCRDNTYIDLLNKL